MLIFVPIDNYYKTLIISLINYITFTPSIEQF